MSNDLSFYALRAANVARIPMFRNAKGEMQHSGMDWTRNDWAVATFGEMGEAANVLKKVRRNDMTVEEARPKLAREFSDVLIYMDALMLACGLKPDRPKIDTFGDLRKLNQASKPGPGPSRNDMMINAFVAFSRAAAMIDEVGRGLLGMHEARAYLATQFHSVLCYMDTLAADCGIDLSDAIMETFNAKSEQLELDLFITELGFVRERRE